MRPTLPHSLRLALAACLLAPHAASAQSGRSPSASQQPGAARLVVQVEYFQGAVPAFQPVPGGSWFGRFELVGPPQLRWADPPQTVERPEPCSPWSRDCAPAGPPQLRPGETVRAVGVKTRAAGDGSVEIAVGVHVGVTHFERFEEAGKYTAAPGERVAALALMRYGVRPFRFRVLRVGEADAAPPSISNQTQSIEAVVEDFTPAPLPRVRLVLRNLSAKRVRAVYVRQYVGGRSRGEGFVGAREGRTLLEPGGTAEKDFVARTGEARNASDFTPAAAERIEVASVVFEDYTFEGEAEPAARRRAFAEGERAQLPRLLALLRAASEAPDVGAPDAARRLGERVAALRDDAPRSAVDAVHAGHPGLEYLGPGRWKMSVGVSMHSARRGLLDDLEQFEQRLKDSPAGTSFKDWLEQKRAQFEAWLARL